MTITHFSIRARGSEVVLEGPNRITSSRGFKSVRVKDFMAMIEAIPEGYLGLTPIEHVFEERLRLESVSVLGPGRFEARDDYDAISDARLELVARGDGSIDMKVNHVDNLKATTSHNSYVTFKGEFETCQLEARNRSSISTKYCSKNAHVATFENAYVVLGRGPECLATKLPRGNSTICEREAKSKNNLAKKENDKFGD